MTFNSKEEALEYMQRNGVDISTLNDEFWQSVNISSAQPEFQVIAEMLYDLYQEADWKESKHHVPFEKEIYKNYYHDMHNAYMLNYNQSIDEDEYYQKHGKFSPEFRKLMDNIYEDLTSTYAMKISASMCAKLSYNTQDNDDTFEKHMERAEMLLQHKHWEPFSHQATAMSGEEASKLVTTKIMSLSKYEKNKHNLGKHSVEIDGDTVYVMMTGVAYNLRGFMSQRYILENL